MKIAYFAHDLNDPAIERRTRMLRAGGAEVSLLGFRRGDRAPAQVAGAPAVDLGRTYDGRMGHRALLAALRALNPLRWRASIEGCDVVLARNLEMLTVAIRARDLSAPRARLVYECLDVHRLMMSGGAAGRLLRALERALLRRCSLLLVSSPAFVEQYFRPVQRLAKPHLLVENKVLLPQPTTRKPARVPRPDGPPWRIGWFGVIRCAKSLAILSSIARRNPDLVEVVIRGRPARHEFEDFDGLVATLPNLRFEGPYSPDELPALYGQVHFTWAIDYFEEGQNSAMLLSNRLYEGALHGSVALAQAGLESGRWVAARQAGLVMADPEAETESLLRALTPERYRMFAEKVAALPLSDLAATPADCADLVRRLAA